MSDDTAPAEGQADVQSAPDEGQAQTQDWEKQYQELRSAFNQRDQELSELRQFRDYLTNPETQDEALQALGYEVPQEPTSEYEDPYESRLAQIEAAQQQILSRYEQEQQLQQQAQQEQELANYVGGALDQVERNRGEQFNDDELAFITAFAYNNPNEQGQPNVQAAVDRLEAAYTAQQERWLKSKRAPRVPDGQSASKQLDTSTPAGRREAMEQALQSLDDEIALT